MRNRLKTSGIAFGLFAVSLVIAGCEGPVPAPTTFKQFLAKDGSFSCDYPADWDVEGGGRSDNTYAWGKFSQGGALIKVTADVTGSLMADIQKSAQRGAIGG